MYGRKKTQTVNKQRGDHKIHYKTKSDVIRKQGSKTDENEVNVTE